MVVLAIELHQFRVKVLTDGSEDAAQVVQDGFREHAAPVFRNKDQMNVQMKNAMTTVSYVACFYHWPSIQ